MAVSVQEGNRRPPGPKLGPVDYLRLLRGTPLPDLVAAKGFGSADIVHFGLQGEHYYFVLAPDLVCDLFLRLARSTGKGRSTERSRPLLGDGLLTSEGDLHRRQRRLIQPAFHHAQIRAYARVMAEEAARLPAAGDWADGATRDVAADMAAVTLRIVGRTLFTTDLSGDADTVTEAATKLIHLHLRSQSLSRRDAGHAAAARPRGRGGRRRRAGPGGAADGDREPAGRRRRRLGAGHAAGRPGRGRRADVRPAGPGRGDDPPAGRARDDRQRADLDLAAARPAPGGGRPAARRGGRAARPPTADDLAALPWTNAVLAESMRVYPPAWASGRRVLADVTLGDWTLPAGSLASAVQWLTHRDPRWWPEPERFRPERWLDAEGAYDESAPGQPRGAYFPFGMGTRVCIGGAFARTEAALVLATLARAVGAGAGAGARGQAAAGDDPASPRRAADGAAPALIRSYRRGMTHAPALTRPPGPQLGPLELARLLRRRQMTELLERAARQSPGAGALPARRRARLPGEHAGAGPRAVRVAGPGDREGPRPGAGPAAARRRAADQRGRPAPAAAAADPAGLPPRPDRRVRGGHAGGGGRAAGAGRLGRRRRSATWPRTWPT